MSVKIHSPFCFGIVKSSISSITKNCPTTRIKALDQVNGLQQNILHITSKLNDDESVYEVIAADTFSALEIFDLKK